MTERPISAVLARCPTCRLVEQVEQLRAEVEQLRAEVGRLAPDGWMDLSTASAYAGITPAAMHKHTAARTVPFEQDVPGGKCWFKRSLIDKWRQGQRAR